MDPEITTASVDASNDTVGNGTGADGLNNGEVPGTEAMVPKSLYENQKIRAEKAEAALKSNVPAGYDPEQVRKDAEAAALNAMDKRFIDEQGYPDEVKAAVEKVATIQGISLRQAAQDPYVQSLIAEQKRVARIQNASPNASGGGNASYSFDPENPPDVDVSTPEGQKAIEDWERELARCNS